MSRPSHTDTAIDPRPPLAPPPFVGSGASPLALRAPEAARVLGISERALWTATNAGEIPHVRVGRTTIYPVDALRAWLEARAAKSIRRQAREAGA